MPTAPAFQFYTGDWLKSPELTSCSAATRGIWIDLLCRIHELDKDGSIVGTLRSLCRQARCFPEELTTALDELKSSRVCEVEYIPDSDLIKITSRRMARDISKRKKNRERMRDVRSGDEDAESVTHNACTDPAHKEAQNAHLARGRGRLKNEEEEEDEEEVKETVATTTNAGELKEALSKSFYDREWVEPSAANFHRAVETWLTKLGFSCDREVAVPERGDGKSGRLDLVATSPMGLRAAIELDDLTPRYKSMMKIGAFGADLGIVGLRRGKRSTEYAVQDGIDLVLCAGVSGVSAADIDLAQTTWNELAAELGLATIHTMTPKRRASVRARFMELWPVIDEVYGAIRGSPFLLGENDREWKIDFDFLWERRDSWVKILEGKYTNGQSGNRNRTGSRSAQRTTRKQERGLIEW
jgi:hypothetical protein